MWRWRCVSSGACLTCLPHHCTAKHITIQHCTTVVKLGLRRREIGAPTPAGRPLSKCPLFPCGTNQLPATPTCASRYLANQANQALLPHAVHLCTQHTSHTAQHSTAHDGLTGVALQLVY
jgi:hypothetical protein